MLIILQQIEPRSVLAAVEIPAGTKHTSTKGLTGNPAASSTLSAEDSFLAQNWSAVR